MHKKGESILSTLLLGCVGCIRSPPRRYALNVRAGGEVNAFAALPKSKVVRIYVPLFY